MSNERITNEHIGLWVRFERDGRGVSKGRGIGRLASVTDRDAVIEVAGATNEKYARVPLGRVSLWHTRNVVLGLQPAKEQTMEKAKPRTNNQPPTPPSRPDSTDRLVQLDGPEPGPAKHADLDHMDGPTLFHVLLAAKNDVKAAAEMLNEAQTMYDNALDRWKAVNAKVREILTLED